MTKGSELTPGTFVDRRYRIRCVLGRGGFGRTYLAADERRFGELCVLKEFVPKNQGDSVVAQKLYELFHREAKILHKLNHPQIPKFFAVFEENDRLFIVQEFIDGKTYWKLLQERQQRGTAFSEAEVVQWLRHLLPVLAYLHEQNIVHRDISPDNIMLPKRGQLPVLIDFGVVKQAAPHWYEVSSIHPDGSIQASVSVGKLGYAPYEQIRIGQCSPRSDLYALGVTAVVMLTAKPPNMLIDSKSLEWKWQSYVKVHPRLVDILEMMMAEKPQDRYASAQAVLDDLNLLEHLPGLKPAPAITLQYDEGGGVGTLALATEQFSRSAPLHSKPALSDIDTLSDLDSTFVEAQSTKLETLLTQVTGLNCLHSSPNLLTQVHSAAHDRVSSPRITTRIQRRTHASRWLTWVARLQQRWFNPSLDLTQPPSTRLTILVSQPDLPPRKPLSSALVLGLLLLLPVGGVAIGLRSPYIDSLCQTLNNCADGRHFAQRYRLATQQAQEAALLSEKAQNLADLKLAWNRLSDSIAKLKSFPVASQWFITAQETLPDYRNQLQQLQTRLDKETRASQLLDRAKTEAQQADRQTKAAKTPQDLETARSQWRKALATLSAIPDSALIAPQVNQRTQEYTARLQQVGLQIAANPVPSSPAATDAAPQPHSSDSSIAVSPSPAITAPAATPRTPAASPATSPASPATVPKPQPQVASPAAPTAPRSPVVSQPRSPQVPQISLVPATTARLNAPASVAPSPRPSERAAFPMQRAANPHPVPPGNVNLSAGQTVNNVSIRLNGARINPGGTFVANLQVDNQSDRSFGFVPLFAEVRDASGHPVESRVLFHGSEDAMVAPGENIQGEVYLLDRYWNTAGNQNLTLVIREGTSGNRNFYVQF